MGEGDLSCRELTELITDYLEGALPEGERARFEAHLSLCPPCGTYLDQFRETIRTVGRLRCDDIDPEVRRALLDAFRDWKKG